jgi:hydrogenase nickel incorporation protein HypA/HybF
MHELSLCQELIEQVLREAGKNGLQKIDEIEVETGILKEVVPEIMLEAFKSVSRDTAAEGAKLILTNKEARAVCNVCKKEFSPKPDDYTCPTCKKADIDIKQGNEIILKSITAYEK